MRIAIGEKKVYNNEELVIRNEELRETCDRVLIPILLKRNVLLNI